MGETELTQQIANIEGLILRVTWLEQRRFAQDLASFGLTPPQFFVLRSIMSQGEHPTMSALAGDTLQHCATVTGIVDRLVKMGLVQRQRDPRDRRHVLVDMTAGGRQVLEKVRASRRSRLSETLQQLSAADARELLRLMGTYLEIFRLQLEDTPGPGLPEPIVPSGNDPA